MSYYNDDRPSVIGVALSVFKVASAVFLLIGFMAWVTGCANQAELKLAYDAQNRNTELQTEQDHQPICAFKCGTVENPCQNVDLKCYTERPPVVIQKVTGTNDVILGVSEDVMPVIGTGLVWGFGSKMVGDVVDGMGSGNTTTHNTSSVIGDDNNTDTSSAMTATSSDNNQANTTTGDQANNNVAEANDNRGDSADNNVAESNPVTTTNTDSNDQANPVTTTTTTTDNQNQNNPTTTDNQNQNNPITNP